MHSLVRSRSIPPYLVHKKAGFSLTEVVISVGLSCVLLLLLSSGSYALRRALGPLSVSREVQTELRDLHLYITHMLEISDNVYYDAKQNRVLLQDVESSKTTAPFLNEYVYSGGKINRVKYYKTYLLQNPSYYKQVSKHTVFSKLSAAKLSYIDEHTLRLEATGSSVKSIWAEEELYTLRIDLIYYKPVVMIP